MNNNAQKCEQHDAAIYSLLADTEIGGEIRPPGFEFCRYCIEGRIRCAHCGFTGYVTNFRVEGNRHPDRSYDVLRCGQTGCEKRLARTGDLPPQSEHSVAC